MDGDPGYSVPLAVLEAMTDFTYEGRRDGGRKDGTGRPQRGYPTSEAARDALALAAGCVVRSNIRWEEP